MRLQSTFDLALIIVRQDLWIYIKMNALGFAHLMEALRAHLGVHVKRTFSFPFQCYTSQMAFKQMLVTYSGHT